ncbi:MAG: hypothetical protein HY841_13835 [Bacteroidetes bacterium]|nr:hypothetical protein [Bacteroidota bacterium]
MKNTNNKTNEQILDELYSSGQKEIRLDWLEEKGFNISVIQSETTYGSSVLLSSTRFENQIIGDYELIFLNEKSTQLTVYFRIEKINYWSDYKELVQQARKLINRKLVIVNTLWAYKFDSDISDPEGAAHYEEEKIKVEKEIKELISKIDELSNAFSTSIEYIKRELLK